jgi:hypothetical protein
MARSPQTEIRLRFLVEDPVAGVVHSLQDKQNRPVAARRAEPGAPLTFDFPVRVAPGPRFLGAFVRSEGPARRFVYIAVGQPAGDHGSCWSRRMKIDIHDVPAPLLEAALQGGTLEATIPGTAKDGTPSCATVPVKSWRTT